MIVLLRNCLPRTADEVDPAEVPEFLPYRHETDAGKRRIVGVGHSIGGNAL